MTEQNEQNFENAVAEPTYLPTKYAHKGYTDTFYDEKESAGAGSFLLGAVVGGVIGAAAALFLAPKTGQEMRDDLSTQATQIKEKSIELSAIAKDKATEYSAVAKDKATKYSAVAKEKATELTATAKEKTEEMTKTIQEQTEQITDKVKSLKKTVESAANDEAVSTEVEENLTATAEALKEAVVEKVKEEK